MQWSASVRAGFTIISDKSLTIAKAFGVREKNICKVGLDTGRWTWRHNNIVNYVVNSLDTEKFSVHSDVPGHESNGGGTIPPEVCITNLKPDITIWDKTNKKFIWC